MATAEKMVGASPTPLDLARENIAAAECVQPNGPATMFATLACGHALTALVEELRELRRVLTAGLQLCEDCGQRRADCVDEHDGIIRWCRPCWQARKRAAAS